MNHGVILNACQIEILQFWDHFQLLDLQLAKKITMFHLKLYLVLKETAQLLAV